MISSTQVLRNEANSPLFSETFHPFFDHSPQAMWAFRLSDARFIAVNQAACGRYGYSREEFSKMTLFEIRSPEEAEKLESFFDTVQRSGWPTSPSVWEHITKSGERLLIEVLSNVIEIDGEQAVFAVLRDVSLEYRLQSEQSRFFDLSKDLISIRNLDGKLVTVNPSVERVLGYTAEEFAQLTPSDLVHPDDVGIRGATLQTSEQEDRVYTWEARIRTKEGNYRWLQWSTVNDKAHRLKFSLARDVTEQRELLEAVRERNASLAWAQSVSHLGSWSLDVATDTFTLSDETYRITGYEPCGYVPTWDKLVSFVHPDDLHLVEMDHATFSPENPSWQSEVRLVRPSGEVRVVVSYVELVFDESRTLRKMHGTIQDITEQKKAWETQQWFAEIVSSSIDAIIGKSLDGTILSWNKAAEQLYGFSASEMIGQNIERIVPSHRRSELSEILAKLRRGEKVLELETERIHATGRQFEVSITISPIVTESQGIIGAATIARDISARKDAERRLAIRLSQLTALRSIDLAIGGIFNLEHTFQIVIDQTLIATDVEGVCIYVKNRETGNSLLFGQKCRGGGPFKDRNAVESLALHTIEHREPARFVEADGLVYDARPLAAMGDMHGSLIVRYYPESHDAREQSHFLDILAGQAGIAIESVCLFQDLQASHDELESAYDQTLEGWARALDLRDHETEGHSRRVTDLTMRLAAKLDLPPGDMVDIRRGALLHDIGKLGVPDSVLLKPGPLTDEEREVMRRHPTYGRDIVAPIEFLRGALDIPYCHHEKWDGSGYPQGLKGEEIPLAARLFALSDVWDALRSDRPYRQGWCVERVCDYIESEAGKHFDPQLVPLFLSMVAEAVPGAFHSR